MSEPWYRRHAWVRGYCANWFPGARAWLRRHTGLHVLERGRDGDGQASHFLLAAYHPRESITWLWLLWWWPPKSWRRPLGTFHWATQRRMPWRKGAFTNGESLH